MRPLSTTGTWADPMFAERYDATFGTRVAPIVASMLFERATPIKGERTLECACGTGASTALFARSLSDEAFFVACDRSAAMLAVAARKPAQVGSAHPAFVQQDFHNLGFAAGVFELVVCSLGMHIGEDQTKALKEILRVIRPAGRFIFTVPVAWSLEPFWTLFCDRAARIDAAATLEQPARAWSPAAKSHELANEIQTWTGKLLNAGLRDLALTEESRVVWFASVEEFFETNPFGQVLRTMALITDESIRTRVYQDIRDSLEATRESLGIPITVAILCGKAGS